MKIGIDILINKFIIKELELSLDDSLFSDCCPIKTKAIVQEKVDAFIANNLDWKWHHK